MPLDGFEAGERFRNQQTKLFPEDEPLPVKEQVQISEPVLSIRDPPKDKTLSLLPQTRKKGKVPLPVRVRFSKGHNNHEFLHLRCCCYSPRGADSDYDAGKYGSGSSDCSQTVKRIDGVLYKAPFYCTRDNHASNAHAYHSLINYHPLDHLDLKERMKITAGFKLLFGKTNEPVKKRNVTGRKKEIETHENRTMS